MAVAAVIGGGPAGLIAAETLAAAGLGVTVYDRMPSVGRKLLIAGRGGLNLTHSEPVPAFVPRYGERAAFLAPLIEAFSPDDLRAWAAFLGIETFVGSSGRVFPVQLRASPLLRAWLRRLDALGVAVRTRHRWIGIDEAGAPVVEDAEGRRQAVQADAVVLALGGSSWPRLGSDAAWVPLLAERGIAVAPLVPSNMGFEIAWSPGFVARNAGVPLKRIALIFGATTVRGEAMLTAYGIEGGAVYALSGPLRDALASGGPAVPILDLKPDLGLAAVEAKLRAGWGSGSTANLLRRALGLAGPTYSLLRELTPGHLADPARLAAAIKALPLPLLRPRPIERAISSAGGVQLDELDENLMLRRLPGWFAAGEMLDWEAPTGGYLLQGAFSTGVAAARGVLRWLGTEGRAR